ncbi:hypothetical protein PC116_g12679 [Phytophthora cactorum]|nr:hypothetical protein PC116_g12679 [Phytophthora cactorum]
MPTSMRKPTSLLSTSSPAPPIITTLDSSSPIAGLTNTTHLLHWPCSQFVELCALHDLLAHHARATPSHAFLTGSATVGLTDSYLTGSHLRHLLLRQQQAHD